MADVLSFDAITTFIFDIDGVLTDGMILVLENGLQARSMNIKDGFALQLAVKKGYNILIVSGAAVSPVVDRLHKLGIQQVHMGVTDKKEFIAGWIADNKLSKNEILFMGDDLPDLAAMSLAGIAACPADAAFEVQAAAHYNSFRNGGAGCVRDVIEKVLGSRGHWGAGQDIASR